MFSTKAVAVASKIHILPRKDLVIVKKADLLSRRTQKSLKLRNKGLLSLDGGGLRGILTGGHSASPTSCLLSFTC